MIMSFNLSIEKIKIYNGYIISLVGYYIFCE